MAFSGQYAAAQLHHLPLPHLVIAELSEYLGYAPDFVPPMFVAWARRYGRLPDTAGWSHGPTVNIQVLELEDGIEGTTIVTASYTAGLEGEYLRAGYVDCQLAMARVVAGASTLYYMSIRMTLDGGHDNFLDRWNRTYSNHWPYTGRPHHDDNVHPAIGGAVRITNTFARRWHDHGYGLIMFRAERNCRLEV